ncbi:MAG: hypothetical protein QOG52_1775 [Frankiaceae bacterium]|nr:hypothetical protein [Frankiaceae bacterium]
MSIRLFVSSFAAGVVALLCVGVAPAQASGEAPMATTVRVSLSVPRSVTVYANGATGASATFRVTARDTAGNGLRVACTRASGAVFHLGKTVVTCTAKSRLGAAGTASFPVVVAVRGGRFAAPLLAAGLVQKGDQLHASFRLYGADGLTGLSDAFASSLNANGRISVHAQQVGAKTATSQPLTYSPTTHRFSTTVQTFAWVGGADYRVWYSVTAADGTLIAGRAVVLGVRLGA